MDGTDFNGYQFQAVFKESSQSSWLAIRVICLTFLRISAATSAAMYGVAESTIMGGLKSGAVKSYCREYNQFETNIGNNEFHHYFAYMAGELWCVLQFFSKFMILRCRFSM